MSDVVVLQFKAYRDDVTLEKRVEARAVDPETDLPVASLPLVEMADWLRHRGYVWRVGSSGQWVKVA